MFSIKKFHYICCIVVILILIILDQCCKIAIDNNLFVIDNIQCVSNALHIHPVLNDVDIQNLMPIAEKYSLPIKVLLIVKAIAFTIVTIAIFIASSLVHRFFFWDCNKKNYSILNYSVICLIMSGLVCSLYIDELFWGGSLDWICLSWVNMDYSIEDHSHHIMRQLVFDIKDVYFVCGMILFVVRVSLFNMTYIKASEFERKGFNEKIKHPISNIRRMVSSSKKNKNISI